MPKGLRRERARKPGRTSRGRSRRAPSRHYQKLKEGTVNVTIRTLERLARGFGVDVRRLFEP